MTSSRAFGKSGSQVCSTVSAPSAGSCSPTATRTGSSLPRTSSAKSAPAQASSTRAKASTSAVLERPVDDAVDEDGGVAVAGREVDDAETVVAALGGAPEEARPSSSKGVGIAPTGLMPDEPLDAVAARGPAPAGPRRRPSSGRRARRLGAKLVGDGEEVARRLVEGLVSLLASAVTEAAHVGEDPRANPRVEVVDERAPALRGAEPAVGQQDGARAGPDDVVRRST